jgi:hypothetical protein
MKQHPYNLVLALIGETQDGGKIGKDAYGTFLHTIISENSTIDEFYGENKEERATVNMEEVADNLRYAISEFKRALEQAERMAEIQKVQSINS